jgi:hypothetical protein
VLSVPISAVTTRIKIKGGGTKEVSDIAVKDDEENETSLLTAKSYRKRRKTGGCFCSKRHQGYENRS